jgi:hypothetical protein
MIRHKKTCRGLQVFRKGCFKILDSATVIAVRAFAFIATTSENKLSEGFTLFDQKEK